VIITSSSLASAAPNLNIENQDLTEVPVTVPEPLSVVSPTESPIEVPKVKEPVVEPVPVVTPAVKVPQPTVHPKGCEQYRQLISQYDWRIETAMAVMKAESSCNSQVVNNNPNTRDYSVGLFQINLYGANARTRPSEAELKDPATNIAWAYKLYSGNGNSFIGQWGVCRTKVSCY